MDVVHAYRIDAGRHADRDRGSRPTEPIVG
jgi:hypothetical protein